MTTKNPFYVKVPRSVTTVTCECHADAALFVPDWDWDDLTVGAARVFGGRNHALRRRRAARWLVRKVQVR